MNIENANRDELLSALYDAVNPLADVVNLQSQINNNEALMNQNANGISITRIIKAALKSFGVFIALMIIVSFIGAGMQMANSEKSGLGLFVIPFLVPIPYFIYTLNKWKKERLKENQKIAPIIEELKNQMRSIFANSRELLNWIPSNYCNYYTVREFIQILENYRANSFKELANVYEQDLYSKRIIQGQDEIKAQQISIAMINSMQQAYNTQRVTDAINYGWDY